MGKGFVHEHEGGCVINIDVVPGAPKTELGKVNEWRGALQIKVAAQPKEGEANDELLRFIADKVGVPRSSVTITKGGTSRHKTVVIGAPKEQVEKALGVS